MSSLQVYVIDKTGRVEHLADAHNSGAGFPWIWDRIALKHTGKRFPILGGDAEARAVWRLFGTPGLSAVENIIMGMSYDNVWIARKRLFDVQNSLVRWWPENCHISETGALGMFNGMVEPTLMFLVGILECVPDDAIGVCFNGTSVNSNPWRVKTDDTDDETFPFVFGADSKLVGGGEPWELFERLQTVHGMTTRYDLRNGLVAVWEPVKA